jgi:hypothetical protein
VAAKGLSALVTSALRPKKASIGRPLQTTEPSPGARVTRATEVLRLPVAR